MHSFHLLALALVTLFSSLSPVSSLAVLQTPLANGDSSTPKYVVAHFMVGNTYPYTINDWIQDFSLASSKGFDAFALNVGRDPWQPDRIADAFRAASSTSFKLFFSFDMTSLPCATPSDADILRNYITSYHAHPSYLTYLIKPLISTFSGETCTFGSSSLNQGWSRAIKAVGLPQVHFVPAFFVDPKTFPSLDVLDGCFNWNSAWPAGNYDINTDSDKTYISNLGGRTYMAGVSPWFFTHYGPDTYNKNYIYRGDNWLPSQRFQLLINELQNVSIAQVITWNDYGESHYVGPVHGAQPGSQNWVNGFDHTGWLDLIEYYIVAFKSGEYPRINRDRVFLWARLYPASADAPDRIGRPNNWEWTEDYIWGVVFLALPAQVTLSCGPSTQTTSLSAGVSQLKLALFEVCDVQATIWRGAREVLHFAPDGFKFDTSSPSYNFNAFVAAST